jgi:thioredoxin reductase/CRP-like cAMP-binding protein/Pyruvate/2-oxoacid:ferredoxin oxidoreductase delta subunit
MGETYRIAIVGSGPGGLSAACRAAEMGDSHVLLEAQPHLSNTIFRYQKGKHVMAEPTVLPLRASTKFEAGKREVILDAWNRDVAARKANIRYKAEVTKIEKAGDTFKLTTAAGEVLAERVVLAIGVQGNLRKLGAPGEDLPYVQYQLDDPEEYKNEVIAVVGAGDAAIENAVALAAQNTVFIINRRAEFSRAKDGNNALILQAIEEGRVKAYYNAGVDGVVESGNGGRRMTLKLNTRDGVVDLPCDRIIGRLGATPPREFVEACGIKFPSKDPVAVPSVSATYESNVPGLYIVGALAGYPLIKQAMNQGYEVVEFIQNRPVVPADQPLLLNKFSIFTNVQDVDAVLTVLKKNVPLFKPLTHLQMREFLLDSQFWSPAEGDNVFTKDDYSNSLFAVVTGEVIVKVDENDPSKDRLIRARKIFGEMGLISGRRRAATIVAGRDAVLLEIPRRSMLKLINSHQEIRDLVDKTFANRALRMYLAPEAEEEQLAPVLASCKLCQFKANETIYKEGEPADAIHLIRSGSVTLAANAGGREVVLSYLAAGQYFGEVDLVAGDKRKQLARASTKTETIRIDGAAFLKLLADNPQLREGVRARFRDQIQQRVRMEQAPERGAVMQFLLGEGLGEATDALLIDESLCVRCDQCEKACAATHGNVSRLDREAGATFDELHVPTSCRHCEHPHCMKDCPPDAIHRAPNGEVYIQPTCIGCGNCERNCPYDVIHMGIETKTEPSLWRWMLFGAGPTPGDENHVYPEGAIKKAVKCDMCRDRPEGPACVQACPTGAALRVGPEEFFAIISHSGG